MEVRKFRCRVISPLFMAGADGVTPELRTPEIKAMMRFWWRAAMAEEDLNSLRYKESRIFGGVVKEGNEEKLIKSPFSISITEKNIRIGEFRPLPHSHNKRFTFKGIAPGSYFKIKMAGKALELPEASLFLAIYLGGFGKRARRGFGSLVLEEIDLSFEKILQYLNKISDGKFKISKDKNESIIEIKGGGGNYPWIRAVKRGKIYSTLDGLLKKIGEASHKYNHPSLGNAKEGRFASPVYVSIYKTIDGYYPVVTLLNTFYPEKLRKWVKDTQKIQENFVKFILR